MIVDWLDSETIIQGPLTGTLGITTPIVTITSPSGGATNDNTPLLEYTSDQVGCTIVVTVDGTPVATRDGESLATLSEGAHTIRVEATNTDELAGDDEVVITVDSTPPTLTIDLSADAPIVSGTMESGATVTVVPVGPATVGAVSYPTSTTWLCSEITGLVYGENVFNV